MKEKNGVATRHPFRYYETTLDSGSTSVIINGGGTTIAKDLYLPYGDVRYQWRTGSPPITTQTQYRYTSQRLETGIAAPAATWNGIAVERGLYFYGARWYDAYINRWVQPDTVIPDPGDPQSLNRYSYAANNPLRFIDPSGHDPLDAAWQEEFYTIHGREPSAEDILIRLFSIAFPDEWSWSTFYDAEGAYIAGSIESIFRDNRPADRAWDDVPGALERLAGWYNEGEDRLFTRDIGSLFGGLANRFETPDAWTAITRSDNPIRTWVYVSRQGLPEELTGPSDRDANIHHWGWALVMGAEYGPGGSVLNVGREIQRFGGNWANSWSDVGMGNRGAAMGFHFRLLGLNNIRRTWNRFMLNQWF